MLILEKFLVNELNINDENVINKFRRYNELIFDWNSKINLVSRKINSIESLILNSIFFLTKYSIPINSNIIDIGTGGGFPGIPLKILRDDLKITFLDSIHKKVDALENISSELRFKNIEFVCGRAEDIAKQKQFTKKYNIAIAKSVSSLINLYRWSLELIKNTGEMVFIKGGDINEEISELTDKYKRINYRRIDFTYDSSYGIEEKKIIVINNK